MTPESICFEVLSSGDKRRSSMDGLLWLNPIDSPLTRLDLSVIDAPVDATFFCLCEG